MPMSAASWLDTHAPRRVLKKTQAAALADGDDVVDARQRHRVQGGTHPRPLTGNIVMAHVGMVYIVMAHVVMVCIVMATEFREALARVR